MMKYCYNSRLSTSRILRLKSADFFLVAINPTPLFCSHLLLVIPEDPPYQSGSQEPLEMSVICESKVPIKISTAEEPDLGPVPRKRCVESTSGSCVRFFVTLV